MKGKILALIALVLIAINIRVNAASKADVKVQVNGKIDKGEKIEILININDIKSFFAGAVEFKYDSNILKITSIEGGNLVNQNNINKFEAIKKIDEGKAIASYGFSCLGKINGYSGSGTFVKINAEIIEKGDFIINSKPFLKETTKDFNLKVQICDSDIRELDYNFNGFVFNNGSEIAIESNTSANVENAQTHNSGDTSGKVNNPENEKQEDNKNSSSSVVANNDGNQVDEKTSNVSRTDSNNSNKSDRGSGRIIVTSIIIMILSACFYFLYWKKKSVN